MDAKLADVAFPVEDQLAAMEVHPQVRGVGLADDANHHWRTNDEGCDGRRHDPSHRGAGDVDARGRSRDDAALVWDDAVDEVLSHACPDCAVMQGPDLSLVEAVLLGKPAVNFRPPRSVKLVKSRGGPCCGSAALITLVVFGFVAFVLWLVAAHIRAKIRHRRRCRKSSLRSSLHRRSLRTFSIAKRASFSSAARRRRRRLLGSHRRRDLESEQIGIAIGWGVLVLCVGAAVLVVRGVTLPGAVITALGIGLLFNSLLRAWFFWKR